MARGFTTSIMVTTVEDFTEEALAAEVLANGQLTEVETLEYLPGAVKAATDLCNVLGNGPFVIEIHGEDHTTEPGELNELSVRVTSVYTVPPVVAAPVEAPSDSQAVAPAETEVASTAPVEAAGTAEPTAPTADVPGVSEAAGAVEGDALNADSPADPVLPDAAAPEGSEAQVPGA